MFISQVYAHEDGSAEPVLQQGPISTTSIVIILVAVIAAYFIFKLITKIIMRLFAFGILIIGSGVGISYNQIPETLANMGIPHESIPIVGSLLPTPEALNKETSFHEHFDLVVFLDGEQLDLSQEKYQSSTYEYKDKHIHLHDGNGSVIHLHKPDVSLHTFFETLDMNLGDDCLVLDTLQEFCTNEEKSFYIVVNGQKLSDVISEYIPNDEDRILVYYGDDDQEVLDTIFETVSDDACMYSLTCPERGEPPAENCIADPDVPCVL